MEAEVAVFRNSERIPILLSPIHRPVGLIICQNVFSRCAVVAAEIPRSPTGIGARMSYRKWRENKQQLIRWPELVLLGLCLVSLHFRCDILAPIPVHSWARSSITAAFWSLTIRIHGIFRKDGNSENFESLSQEEGNTRHVHILELRVALKSLSRSFCVSPWIH